MPALGAAVSALPGGGNSNKVPRSLRMKTSAPLFPDILWAGIMCAKRYELKFPRTQHIVQVREREKGIFLSVILMMRPLCWDVPQDSNQNDKTLVFRSKGPESPDQQA